jgi:hypothetical protein
MADDEDKKKKPPVDEGKDKKPPKEDKKQPSAEDAPPPKEDKPEVKDIDADSIIDAFLEENPDLVDLPVDEWPEEAIAMLKDTFNDEGVDAPNGVLPDEEDAGGEPIGNSAPVEAAAEIDAPTTEVDNPDQDFDIMELAKLVEAGDKDGAWDMLQQMFGIQSPEPETPSNALGRMVSSSSSGDGGNALARLIGSLR